MSESPRIKQFMTKSPHSIGVNQTMNTAHEMMRRHNIRHLPVMEGGELVGIVTERDLHLLETLQDIDPKELSVEEAMGQSVYAVTPESSLAKVVEHMAERKIGSAVILEQEKVVGLFTTTDALIALAQTLRE